MKVLFTTTMNTDHMKIHFIPNQSFMKILHGYKLVRLSYADIFHYMYKEED